MAPNPANNRPLEEDEHYPLSDISDYQLDQLTELLWMDQSVNAVMPNQVWLQSQFDGVARLDKSNRRSKNLWKRISSGLENFSLAPRHVHDGRPTACLCDAHHDLDPKLIRRLMGLIIIECTVRIHRFRYWRRYIDFPPAILLWLDRMDAVTGLWMTRDAFNATFGYDRVCPNQNKVLSKCEACIMAAIGGRPQVLTYLRASMIGRRDRRFDKGLKTPRLLRVVESWIGHFKADVRKAIVTGSHEVRQQLDNLDAILGTLEKDRPISDLSRSSRHRNSNTHEADERPAHGHRKRTSREASSRSYSMEGSHQTRPSHEYNTEAEQEWMDTDEACQASIYLDCQMQKRGLTASKRREMFEQDMHPAFRDYTQDAAGMSAGDRLQNDAEPKLENDAISSFSSPSAIPAPLSLAKKPQKPPTPPRSTSDNDPAESIWEPVSVFSPPQSVVGDSPTRRAPIAPNREIDNDSLFTTFADNQAHLEFCQRWGLAPGSDFREPPAASGAPQTQTPTRQNSDARSVAAASSVYSDHPGFRRSQQYDTTPAIPPKSRLRESRAASSHSGRSRAAHRQSRDQRGNSLWNSLQENRASMIEEYENEE
ncbi:uncharacterized protein FIESC28_07898 [Fusarium coffeatum]|uniref:Uncharacterized protein n=1 Tax=Fusarium coffeatum TaxID=231269 RepID=A0A366RBV4_9HYPO|nr:uncharacterized protein FIESC28_07898 [Fusarium coffeatum]RBR14048.1 hypothetical protein FIESC28_07898 [Fusarium coffeatum]